MNFVEFANKYNKMCGLIDNCSECPFRHINYENCTEWTLNHPEEAERVVIEWHATHKTNREKFMEVFGHTFDDPNAICSEMFYIYSPITKNSLDYTAEDELWWDQLYKEPKGR